MKDIYIYAGSETEKAYTKLLHAIWEKEYDVVSWHWTRLYEMVDELVDAVRKDCMKSGGGSIDK